VPIEHLLKAFADFTRDGAYILVARPSADPEPQILWCNEAVCRQTGYSRDEILGASPDLFQGRDTHPATKDAVNTALREGASGRVDILHYTKAGDPEWVEMELNALSSAAEGATYFAVIERDITQQRAQDAELAGTRNGAHAAMESAAAGIWVLEPIVGPGGQVDDFIWREANPTALRTLGHDLRTLIGSRLRAILPATEANGMFAFCARAIETGEAQNFEVRHDVDRRDCWLQVFVRATGDGLIAASFLDVTSARKAADKAAGATPKQVAEASARLSNLTDAVPGALFQTFCSDDGAMTHTHLSAGVEGVFGISAATIHEEPRSLYRRIAPEDFPVWRELTQQMNATGGGFDLTYRYMHPTRGYIHVRTVARAERVKGGAICHAYSSDVTEAVRREADLRAAKEDSERLEQRLRLAASAGQIGFWLYDATDDRLEWDDAMFDLYGVPRSAFRGNILDWSDRVHPDDLELAKQSIAAALESGDDLNSRFRVLRPDGQVVHIVGCAARDQTRTDRSVLVGVNWEATEFVEARERAEAGSQAKGLFLANMSHEIRTPLNGVIGLAGLLAKTSLNRRQSEMVDLIRSSGETLQTLLNDILDMSKIEAGKLDLELRTINVADEIKAVAFPLWASALEKGLAFSVVVDPAAEGLFIADPVRLRQVVANLASNAVKFTSAGHVRIEVGYGHSAFTSAEAVSITVRDTGIGFDQEIRERLFNRFEQADGSITRSFGGSGLGLSIVKSLVELMRGGMEVRSSPGAGSVFTVHLPLLRASAQNAVDPSPLSVADVYGRNGLGAPLRILVAEDNPTNQKVIAFMLEAIGADLRTVANGALAVEAFERETFDLVLMDMQMPVMDGLTAIQRIRAFEHALGRQRTPVLMLTANAMEEHVRLALAAGSDLHVAKPITPEALLSKVAQAIQLFGSGDAGLRTAH
jgi:PAS domain S-box-containing protein